MDIDLCRGRYSIFRARLVTTLRSLSGKTSAAVFSEVWAIFIVPCAVRIKRLCVVTSVTARTLGVALPLIFLNALSVLTKDVGGKTRY